MPISGTDSRERRQLGLPPAIGNGTDWPGNPGSPGLRPIPHAGHAPVMDDALHTLARDEIGPDWRALLCRAVPGGEDDPRALARVIKAVRALDRLRPGTGRRWLRGWGSGERRAVSENSC
jgi:sirohydrochlorin ferrochelatase